MNILSTIFSGGAKDLVEGVGGVIDDLHTSEEEKLEAGQKVKELSSNYEVEMEKQITDRWKSDMDSDSWLSKNVRPMVLIFLVISTVLTTKNTRTIGLTFLDNHESEAISDFHLSVICFSISTS